jgi:hypothetical protein
LDTVETENIPDEAPESAEEKIIIECDLAMETEVIGSDGSDDSLAELKFSHRVKRKKKEEAYPLQ